MSVIARGEKFFDVHRLYWKIMGHMPATKYALVNSFHFWLVNLGITIWNPLHLLLALPTTETALGVFEILSIGLPCVVASVKSLLIWWNLDKVRAIEAIMKKLDARVTAKDELYYYEKHVLPAAKRLVYLLYFLCFGTEFVSEMAVLVAGMLGDWQLMHTGYFPFNPFSSALNYGTAHLYQLLAITVQGMQNIINDTIGSMRVVMLAGHVHMLSMRVAKIGYDAKKTRAENNAELVACIKDHKDLLEYHRVVWELMRWCMFVQITFNALNLCVVVVFVAFFMETVFDYAFYGILGFAVIMEIYPSCYYGTILELEFQNMTYAIFKCNWTDQSKEFKQNLRLFAEQTLKEKFLMAGDMFRINLYTFFVVCKTTYSLFAVILQMK